MTDLIGAMSGLLHAAGFEDDAVHSMIRVMGVAVMSNDGFPDLVKMEDLEDEDYTARCEFWVLKDVVKNQYAEIGGLQQIRFVDNLPTLQFPTRTAALFFKLQMDIQGLEDTHPNCVVNVAYTIRMTQFPDFIFVGFDGKAPRWLRRDQIEESSGLRPLLFANRTAAIHIKSAITGYTDNTLAIVPVPIPKISRDKEVVQEDFVDTRHIDLT